MAAIISKTKNAMSKGGKMISNNLSFLYSLLGVLRMAKILFKQHFDTNAGAIDWDSNTGVMLSGEMSISS